MTAPGQVATLIVPADVAWSESVDTGETPVEAPAMAHAAEDAVAAAARALGTGEPAVLLLRGMTLRELGLEWASRIARRTGARVFCDTFIGRLERGA